MEAKYMTWCNENGLKIYPIPQITGDYKLAVSKLKNGRWIENIGQKTYSKKPRIGEEKWWNVIDKLYRHYYLLANDIEYKRNHHNKPKETAA